MTQRAVIGRMMAAARPGAMPMPHTREFNAFTKPELVDKWAEESVRLRAAGPAAANVIEMYDVIGEDWWTGGGVTVAGVLQQLRTFKGQPVEVQINSPGGDMFEGIAIYNALREHDGEITVKVMGMAASAASIIAMAGDRIEIGASSFFMIHNCWVLVVGNRHDMARAAGDMEQFDAAMAAVYQQRTGQDAAEIAAWMDAETWMSGATAIERRFADALLPSDSIGEGDAPAAAATDARAVRTLEKTLLAQGRSRAEARKIINQIKGKPDAAHEGTPDAADTDWMQAMGAASELLKNLRS